MSDFIDACEKGDIDIVKSSINIHGVNGSIGWVRWREACRNGHRHIIDIFISHSIEQSDGGFTIGLSGACEGGQLEMV